MDNYINDLLILVGFCAAVAGMWQLAPWLVAVWVGLLLITIGLYRARGEA